MSGPYREAAEMKRLTQYTLTREEVLEAVVDFVNNREEYPPEVHPANVETMETTHGARGRLEGLIITLKEREL